MACFWWAEGGTVLFGVAAALAEPVKLAQRNIAQQKQDTAHQYGAGPSL